MVLQKAKSWDASSGVPVKTGGVEVEVTTQMKYLGLILDNHWDFDAYLKLLVPSVEDMVNALGRLLPRIIVSGDGGAGLRRGGAVQDPLRGCDLDDIHDGHPSQTSASQEAA